MRLAETPAYLALGDSLAFGVGAPDPSTGGYVALAYEAIRTSDRYQDRGLELINLAVSGAVSSDLLIEGGQVDAAIEAIESRRQDEESSDDNVEIISLTIGGNDLLNLATPISPCADDAAGEACLDLLGEMLIGLQDNLTMALTRLREAAPDAGIYVLNLYNPYSGTGDSREGLAELAVQQLNGVTGAVVANQELGVRLGDVFHLFRGRGPQWIAEDGLHPNENGHKVMAEVLLATIDGRATRIPLELLSATPAPVGDLGELPDLLDRDDGGVEPWWFLVVVPVAFVAGIVISVAYFLARGRSG
jgi:lysophospholipase L1-like esterase